MGDTGRQLETTGDKGRTRPREGRHVIQHRHTSGETIGDNGRQDLRKADTDTPSNTPTHMGRRWETRGDKTPQRRTHHATQAHMWGDNGKQSEPMGDKASGRRTHHPTHPHMWGDKGRQGEIRPGKADTRSNKGKQEGRLEINGREKETIVDNGRQCETRGDNIQQEGRQWETRGDRTLGEGGHTNYS